MSELNGQSNGQVFVQFGNGPDDQVPLSWAEKMLRELRTEDPKRFGRLLTRAVVGDG